MSKKENPPPPYTVVPHDNRRSQIPPVRSYVSLPSIDNDLVGPDEDTHPGIVMRVARPRKRHPEVF